MIEIPLTRGKVALVDDDDYESLSRYKWFAVQNPSGVWYARRNTARNHGPQGFEFMHRRLMGISGTAQVDHRDGDGLNNTRKNLRFCTHRQNGMNRKVNAGCRFKGVSRSREKYKAAITINGAYVHLGVFSADEEAARAYDRKARETFGEFARLNFPDEGTIK